MKIVVKRIGVCHIYAYIEGDPNFFGEGDSPDEAIGSLISKLAKNGLRDVTIKYE